MSELLAAAAAALSAPEAIVRRSAEARAKASGVTTDEILSAWAGGAPAPVSTPASAPSPAATAPAEAPAPAAATTTFEAPAPVAEVTQPVDPTAIDLIEEPPEPVPLGQRVRLAGRVGAVTGALLGVLAIILSGAWLLPNASLIGPEESLAPSVLLTRRPFVFSAALLSILFGLVVAALSRTLTGWLSPGSALIGRHFTTGLVGGVTGLLLGLAAGSALSSFGAPVEGVEGIVDLPILTAVIVVLIGGAVLGWVTAALVQVVGVPAALAPEESDEVADVRTRLGGAISVPLLGLITLGLLVIPLGVVLIRSNHMASGGAAALAVITAGSILAIAGMSASKPGMKIRRGDFLVAVGGIGVVVLIVFAVFLARSGSAEGGGESAAGEASETVAPTETTGTTAAG
jgi:hypothetical protein